MSQAIVFLTQATQSPQRTTSTYLAHNSKLKTKDNEILDNI